MRGLRSTVYASKAKAFGGPGLLMMTCPDQCCLLGSAVACGLCHSWRLMTFALRVTFVCSGWSPLQGCTVCTRCPTACSTLIELSPVAWTVYCRAPLPCCCNILPLVPPTPAFCRS